jgi:hypothetical protein
MKWRYFPASYVEKLKIFRKTPEKIPQKLPQNCPKTAQKLPTTDLPKQAAH